MKHVYLLAGVAAALVLIACGGTDANNAQGDNGNATGNPVVAPAGTHVEGEVLTPTTFDDGSQTRGQQYVIQDPQTMEAQDKVRFVLAYEDATGRHVLDTNAWTSSDSHSVYGTLIYNSGIFAATTAETPNPQTVSTTYGGQNFSATYQVLPRQVRLRGQVLADDTHAPVGGVEVDFFGPENPADPASNLVFRGRVITAFDGTFRASIPSSVTNFTLVNSTIPDGYQRFFHYKSAYFHANDQTCYAPLPKYSNGERFMITYSNSNVAKNGTILLLSKNQDVPTTACNAP